jgi:hypothetical protein
VATIAPALVKLCVAPVRGHAKRRGSNF